MKRSLEMEANKIAGQAQRKRQRAAGPSNECRSGKKDESGLTMFKIAGSDGFGGDAGRGCAKIRPHLIDVKTVPGRCCAKLGGTCIALPAVISGCRP